MTRTRTLVLLISVIVVAIGVVAVVGLLNQPTQRATPTFTLTTNSTTASLNRDVRLKGTLSVSKTGQVTLYWSIGSSEFGYHTSETMTNGVFERDFGFGQTGTWRFKVFWQGDAEYNEVESNIVIVTVS